MRTFTWAILAFAVLISFSAIHAPDKSLASSVVILESGPAHGSGVHLGNGLILTAQHVAKIKHLRVRTEHGATAPTRVLWSNDLYDLALLQIDAPLAPLNLKSSRLSCALPKSGAEVTLAGNPLDLEFVSTYGRIAGPPRMWGDTLVIPVSSTMIWGMSGGPAFNSNGDVVGINDMVMLGPVFAMGGAIAQSAEGIGFIVPSRVACILMGRL